MSDSADKTLADWESLAARELKGGEPARLAWETPEGITVKPLYTAADLEALEDQPGLPGFAPYTRGVRATMFANRPWTIRQYAGFATAEESNAFYKRNLAGGQKGLSVAFDLATHRGYDSDHPRVRGDVGKAGVAIDTVEDMKRLFDGIPLGEVSVSMTMNGAVLPVLAAYIVAAEEQGVGAEKLGRDHPERHPQGVHGPQHIHLPGPSPACESWRTSSRTRPGTCRASTRSRSPAITCRRPARRWSRSLASPWRMALTMCAAAHSRGLAIDDFAPRLSFFFCIGMNFFMEVAKLRAARLLWARFMRGFEAQDPRSLMLRTHCQTSGVSLAEQDPYNNVVRTAYEALAAVLGGTQSLHTNALDEAVALPTDFSARIARNTQLILQHETGVPQVVDPLGGSYYVEALTASLAREASALIDEVEELGGMTKAVAAGMPSSASRRPRPDARRGSTGARTWSSASTATSRTPTTCPPCSTWTTTRSARRRLRASPRSVPGGTKLPARPRLSG